MPVWYSGFIKRGGGYVTSTKARDQGRPLPDEGQIQSFVIRFWQEPREQPEQSPEWRGRIVHVQSGRHIYFRDLTTLVAFLHKQIGWPETIPEWVTSHSSDEVNDGSGDR